MEILTLNISDTQTPKVYIRSVWLDIMMKNVVIKKQNHLNGNSDTQHFWHSDP